jgi:hypothetical protein
MIFLDRSLVLFDLSASIFESKHIDIKTKYSDQDNTNSIELSLDFFIPSTSHSKPSIYPENLNFKAYLTLLQ